MALISRVKQILLTPKEEWQVIALEKTSISSMLFRYLLPLAVASAIAVFAGLFFISGAFGFVYGIYFALMLFIQLVATISLNALVADKLAPSFHSESNFSQSLRLMIYAGTPVYVGSLLGIIPVIGWLGMLAGAIYSIYLLYLGLPVLKKTPQDKVLQYLVLILIVLLLIYFILQSLLWRLFLV